MRWLIYIFQFISMVPKVVNLLKRSYNLLDELTFITLVKVYNSVFANSASKIDGGKHPHQRI